MKSLENNFSWGWLTFSTYLHSIYSAKCSMYLLSKKPHQPFPQNQLFNKGNQITLSTENVKICNLVFLLSWLKESLSLAFEGLVLTLYGIWIFTKNSRPKLISDRQGNNGYMANLFSEWLLNVKPRILNTYNLVWYFGES